MPHDVPPAAMSAFDAATAVHRGEGGGLLASLDPGWDVGGGILNGGYLLAVAARAAVLDSPHPHAVALSASYLRAPAAGPVTLRVQSAPAGRTLAHSLVTLTDDGGPALSVQVTTATLGDQPSVWSLPMPDAPPVEECFSIAEHRASAPPGLQVPGLSMRVETRLDPRTPAGRSAGRRGSRFSGPGCGSPTGGSPTRWR